MDQNQPTLTPRLVTKKWYQKDISVILLLFLFSPVGLYLMWKNSKWSKTAKWVVTIIFGFAFLSVLGKPSTTTRQIVTQPQTNNVVVDSKNEQAIPTAVVQQTETSKTESKNEPSVPPEYRSALRKATSYANTMHLSKTGVYDQLISEYGEKFSPESAQYAIDNVIADWNANALAKAKNYQDTMSMSPDAIRSQLVSSYGEKFTEAEADYAIQHLND